MNAAIPQRERELKYFLMLDRNEQQEAIHRLAVAGFGDYSIAGATGLSVEMVRSILGQARALAEQAA